METRQNLPSLDAHAHLSPTRTVEELKNCGAVLAMTLSTDEAQQVFQKKVGNIVWGVGCHPRQLNAQETIDTEIFAELASQTALIGEIGLDTGSPVPFERQVKVFRCALAFAAERPRIVSIHSYRATSLVLEELRRRPISAAVLHWWTGTSAETREAAAMGCYFSIHSAVARQSKFRTIVPLERVLVESDHGWSDPPAAIPCRIEWTEHQVAQQYRLEREALRLQCWKNLAALVRQTRTTDFLPGPLRDLLKQVENEPVSYEP